MKRYVVVTTPMRLVSHEDHAVSLMPDRDDYFVMSPLALDFPKLPQNLIFECPTYSETAFGDMPIIILYKARLIVPATHMDEYKGLDERLHGELIVACYEADYKIFNKLDEALLYAEIA